ncbi:hypothetical protein Fot_06369 [Forsythia ovata]|uniref:Uncharacterized protein n=1 Tax=Forsythia ovata TaxID=205694 RepID=A0ABD1WSR8_9LAMI
MFLALKGGLHMISMFWRDIQRRKPIDYKENRLTSNQPEKMARVRYSHAQQHCIQGRKVNIKPSGGVTRNQTGHRPRSSMYPFPGTRSSYDAEITEAIPNLHAGLNALVHGTPDGEVEIRKQSKNPFTGPYCTYHRFYGHKIEDFCNI